MARLTVGQKTTRFLRFLMGARNPRVAALLAGYGFDQAVLDEGWQLLRRVAGDRLGAPQTQISDTLVTRIDAWENQWFPIAGAVLWRYHPESHDVVFHNLTQTQGPAVVLSVSTFIGRLDALAASPAGAEVMATLQRHGLREEVLSEARSMLVQAGQIPPAAAEPAPSSAEAAAREQAMWDYYLQWSVIARQAIDDRRLLRSLGFLQPRRGSDPQAEQEAGDVGAGDVGAGEDGEDAGDAGVETGSTAGSEAGQSA